MGIREIFGFSSNSDAYEVTVEYETGTRGNFPMWAADGRDALIQLSKLIPTHERIVSITFRLRPEGKAFTNKRA